MAQSLGLHRDGSHFPQLTPYEVEIRRRVWWALCFLDVRSSEDQGMDYTIVSGSFDTNFPRNLDDTDINPDTKEPPPERRGLTVMSISIDMCKICDVTRQIMDRERAPTLQEQLRLVEDLYGTLERGYLRYSKESDENIIWWVGITAVRLTMAKMTLFISFPVLFSSASVESTIDTRNKLLVAAIEVAEWNHALNAKQEARQWRWIYQTYTHWHAIVLLLIEIARRPLSPLIERAWLGLRSSWLIPTQGNNWDKKLQIWVPLRKLMAQARKHRDAEIERLRASVQAVEQAAVEDSDIPAPASSCPFLSPEELQKHWRSLFVPFKSSDRTQAPALGQMRDPAQSARAIHGADTSPQQYFSTFSTYGQESEHARTNFVGAQSSQAVSASGDHSLPDITNNEASVEATSSRGRQVFGQNSSPPFAAWSGTQHFDASSVPWLWADADPTTDVFGADLVSYVFKPPFNEICLCHSAFLVVRHGYARSERSNSCDTCLVLCRLSCLDH